MTTWVHRVVIAARTDLSTGARTNKEWLERWGIAINDETLNGPQALRIANGTDPYNVNHPEALNFTSSIYVNGAAREYYIGSGSLTAGRWAKAMDRLVNAPLNGIRYARFVTLDGGVFRLTADLNVPALEPYIGTILEPSEALVIAGMKPKGAT